MLTTIDDFALNFVANALWQVALVTSAAILGLWLLSRMMAAKYRHIVWVTTLILSVLLPLWSALPIRRGLLMAAILPIPITVPNFGKSSDKASPLPAEANIGGQRSEIEPITLKI